MPLLIDGYNLMHVAGILGRGAGPGSLQRSRLALLNFLAESLDPGEVTHTTVVFDSHNAPPGLPRRVEHRGITVHFASEYEEADDLIEELIAASSAPRRLVVVSSDHRIQRAARRRRAKAAESEIWYHEVVRARRERQKTSPEGRVQPAVPLLEEDVNYWLRQFGGASALSEFLRREGGLGPAAPETAADRPRKADVPKPGVPDREKFDEIDNPFPPGYGEDLLKNDDL